MTASDSGAACSAGAATAFSSIVVVTSSSSGSSAMFTLSLGSLSTRVSEIEIARRTHGQRPVAEVHDGRGGRELGPTRLGRIRVLSTLDVVTARALLFEVPGPAPGIGVENVGQGGGTGGAPRTGDEGRYGEVVAGHGAGGRGQRSGQGRRRRLQPPVVGVGRNRRTR